MYRWKPRIKKKKCVESSLSILHFFTVSELRKSGAYLIGSRFDPWRATFTVKTACLCTNTQALWQKTESPCGDIAAALCTHPGTTTECISKATTEGFSERTVWRCWAELSWALFRTSWLFNNTRIRVFQKNERLNHIIDFQRTVMGNGRLKVASTFVSILYIVWWTHWELTQRISFWHSLFILTTVTILWVSLTAD